LLFNHHAKREWREILDAEEWIATRSAFKRYSARSKQNRKLIGSRQEAEGKKNEPETIT
jgi:hypothetical protein